MDSEELIKENASCVPKELPSSEARVKFNFDEEKTSDFLAPKNKLTDLSRSFCTTANIGSAVVYLNQELQNLGLRYKLIEENGMKLNLVSLVNSCWDVIQMYHTAVRDSNALHDRRRREIADFNHLQISAQTLKLEIENKDRLLQDSQEKERQVNSMNKALVSKLKAEKEEIRRLSSILQQREAQQQHINRKKETEINKLQERLHKLVAGDRGTETRVSNLKMTGSLSRYDNTRGKWRTDNTSIKHEEELHRKVLSQYETWLHQLTDEGDQLKECLASLASKISKMVEKCINSKLNLLTEADLLDKSVPWPGVISNSGEEPVFSLDFRSVRDQIQKGLDSNLQLIELSLDNKESHAETLTSLSENKSTNDKDEQDKDDQPDDAIFNNSLANGIELLTESHYAEKEQELKEQMKAVRDEKTKLQRERETFAVAAIRLNREKANFEAEKVELLRYQFLEELPGCLGSNYKEPFTPNTSLEHSPDHSLPNMYGDSPKTLLSMPCLTSPTGNIIRTNHPLTIGTPKAQHKRKTQEGCKNSKRESGSRSRPMRSNVSSSGLGGKSAPATRHSSINRREDYTASSDIQKARTLDRLSKTSCLSTLSLSSGNRVVSPDRSIQRTSRTCGVPCRLQQQPPQHSSMYIPQSCFNNSSSGDSVHEHIERKVSKRYSAELGDNISVSSKPYSKTWSGHHFLEPRSNELRGDDYLTSIDSGFSHDDAESSALASMHPRDAQTNVRLDALESSLVILLEQIKSRSPSEKKICTEVDSSDSHSHCSSLSPRDGANDMLANNFSMSRSFNPPSSSTSVHPTENEQFPSSSFRASRLASAPGSLANSRKSSQDRRLGEDYFKKLQNSFTKWYFKN